MHINRELLPINKFTRPGRKMIEVRGVVIHWTGNPSMDAKGHVRYFNQLSRQNADDDIVDRYASAHYFIGTTGDVYQLIPEDEVAYHAGGKEYVQKTLDHFNCTWPNICLVGLELCHEDWSGKFTDDTIRVSQQLTRDILNRHNLDIKDVVRHFDVTSKLCPKFFVENEEAWKDFCNGI